MNQRTGFNPAAFLAGLPEADVRTVLCADPHNTLARIAQALHPSPDANLLTLPWKRNTLLNRVLRAAVEALAQLAVEQRAKDSRAAMG